MEKQFEIDETIAERIITSKPIIDEALVPYKGIEVSYVGYVDAEGETFKWEESDEEYAIVSFKAMNPHQLATAVEEFENGDFEASANHNLSMRMSVDKAREIIAGATSGTLVCHEVTVEDEDGNEVQALLPKNFVPAVAKVATKVSLKDILAKRAEKRGEEQEEEPKAEPAKDTKKVKLAGAK